VRRVLKLTLMTRGLLVSPVVLSNFVFLFDCVVLGF
jgi:hypothetical protein